ncbi:winged helix-turn-helix transcriptional regulator [Halorutilales archaeon Cl-col2-1]
MLKTLSYSKSEGIIVYLCMNGESRFSEIEEYLGINPSMVDRRLKELIDDGFVETDGEKYVITSKGKEAAVTYNLLSRDKCEEFCNPNTCVGPLSQAVSAISDYSGSVTHEILETLPATTDEISDEVDADEPVENYIESYERWGLVETDDDGTAKPTDKSRKILGLLEA